MGVWTWINTKVQAAMVAALTPKSAPLSTALPVSSPVVTQTGSTQPQIPPVALNVAPTSTVAAVGNAVAAVAGLADDELRLHNSPAMQANASALADQKAKDEINRAIANNDLETLRKLGA